MDAITSASTLVLVCALEERSWPHGDVHTAVERQTCRGKAWAAPESPPKSCTSILRLLTAPPEDTGDPRRRHRPHLAEPEEQHAGARHRHRTPHRRWAAV